MSLLKLPEHCGIMLAGLLAVTMVLAPSSRASPSFHMLRFRFVDTTRTAHFRNGRVVPRTLVTYVRIPAGRGPFPLVVFAHGYESTPGRYARLLDTWARAGFVVAAPLFPLENANAPGGSNESDIVNEPGDMRFVITRLLRISSLHISAAKIAVAGQSDGAETAFAVAEESHYRDPRVRAAVVLSSAELAGGVPIAGPPLLATQGTRDTTNPPRYTARLYAAAHRPKFLLTLVGAGHLAPYTSDNTYFSIVSLVTTAFLDHYLIGGSLDAVVAAARAPRLAALTFSL
ncbi:MAG TPA: hypothetical protein VGU02_10855 [Gaiellaceae bacterium]|nr:hypothetical protein [Gaiellaceae bacterium]